MLSAAASAISQQSILQTNIGMSVLKKAADQQGQIVEMIQASVDASRGRNLDISV
jgi:hypothetical protein